MGERATIQIRRALVQRFVPLYQQAIEQQKEQILSAFVLVTGYHPRYGKWLLTHPGGNEPPTLRRMARQYGPEVQRALETVWNAANPLCVGAVSLHQGIVDLSGSGVKERRIALGQESQLALGLYLARRSQSGGSAPCRDLTLSDRTGYSADKPCCDARVGADQPAGRHNGRASYPIPVA